MDHEDRLTNTTHVSTTTASVLPPLLALAVELRLRIYEEVLLSDKRELHLLRTCRQINMEARSILYQCHLIFTSQAQLFDLLDRSDHINLRRVRTMTLHLTDIELSSLLDQENHSYRRSLWISYQDELEKLDGAIKSLPDLLHLTIVPPKDLNAHHSHFVRGLYLCFLGLIPKQLPRLERLVIEDRCALLARVPSLMELPDVKFTMSGLKEEDHGLIKLEGEGVLVGLRKPLLAEGVTMQAALRRVNCKLKWEQESASMVEWRAIAGMVVKARVSKPAKRARRVLAGL